MAVTMMSELFMQNLSSVRIEPTAKRVRAVLDSLTVVDTNAALLVWEPKRVVPTYAVPQRDIAATVRKAKPVSVESKFDRIPVWDPRIPFAVRQTPGHSVWIDMNGGRSVVAGFVADDPELNGYVILDFDGFDSWLEEDDPIISHPHSPFSRIDIRSTAKHLQFVIDGVLLAETRRALILFETGLPVRYYVPKGDVLVPLQSSDTVTVCAYKGVATYFSPVATESLSRDLAWSYENPLIDAERVRNYICFFDEKLDLTIDGVARPRPTTPWS